MISLSGVGTQGALLLLFVLVVNVSFDKPNHTKIDNLASFIKSINMPVCLSPSCGLPQAGSLSSMPL